MAKFVAKTIAVDNSDLYQLDNFKPFSSPLIVSVGYESKYKNGKLTVKVFADDTLHYKLADQVPRSKAAKLFKGDDWEARFFKGADTIKGSSEGDALYGFKGKDQIYGRGGDDTIYGGKGKDKLYGGEGDDTIYGDQGKDKLYGGDGGDTMDGGKGNDFLDGGTGINYLTGGGGKDTFAFSAPLMGGNYAQIEDFTPGKDTIQLAKSVFEGIGSKGTLKAGSFFLDSEYAGQAKAVIYDEVTGNLSYAKNGGDAVVFGRIANGADLDHKDFLIA